ncbi:GcvT family protein [Arthrobacter rhombi]|uniref:GcvT family protein n=1 Tax=Arthrobacter rhombi TaxID=71253 RepID=UPI003F8EFAFF
MNQPTQPKPPPGDGTVRPAAPSGGGLPGTADVVIIGAGIVGSSLVKHLAEAGWRNMVLLDQGPLPDPGGSTGHASNFIFPVDHQRHVTALTVESMNQFRDLGTLTTCGGIEVARNDAGHNELRRRLASAKSWGVDAELIDPRRIGELAPLIDTSLLTGGFHTPSAAVVDPLAAGELMRQTAFDADALHVFPDTEVTGLLTEPAARGGPARIAGVRTGVGDIATDTVVIACGVWSPKIGAMAGAALPLTPAVHQMINLGPIPGFEASGVEIDTPIIRDMTAKMYERQRWDELQIGSYAHRAILHEAESLARVGTAAWSPTQLPLSEADFSEPLEHARQLFPMLREPGLERTLAIDGLLSLTPDGGALLGPTPEVEGLWSAAAVWIREAPAVGKYLAQWMSDGSAEVDLHADDIARFHPSQRTRSYVRARAEEGFPKTYGIVHPREQFLSARGLRRSPIHGRHIDNGAEFFEAAGWERPQWFASNADLLAEFGDAVPQRTHEWDARWHSPISVAEHLCLRERGVMIDLSAFAQFDVAGPGAMDFLQSLAMAQVDRPVGRVIYTPLLDPRGGFRSDLTLVRLGIGHYRVITGATDAGRDIAWLRSHLPTDGSVHLADLTAATATIGLWGPRARDVLASVSANDVSDAAFGFGSAAHISVRDIPVLAVRISYVGELGWELHTDVDQGMRLWDVIADAGRPFGVRPAGIGVYGGSARLEKGYRLMGAELSADYNPVEAGLALPRVKDAGFVGKPAYLRAREAEPVTVLCTLGMDAPVAGEGPARYPSGSEPILTLEGEAITDAGGRRSFVTSAGDGPSVGRYLLMAYLPPEQAQEGNHLLVEYLAEHHRVTVLSAGRTPVFDPENQRMRT